jgi:hypothetical protein
MKSTTHTLLASLVLVTVAGCIDQPASPTGSATIDGATARYTWGGEECTETMIICDDGSEPPPPTWTDDGFEEVFTDVADGEISLVEDTSQTTSGNPPASYSWSGCPSYIAGSAYGTVYVTNPSGGKTSVTFLSWGIWSWHSDLGPNRARYNWPPGYWDAVDGSGIEVQVGSAEGTCRVNDRGNVYVALGPKYYHVNARFPRRRGYTPTSGGGGSGGGGGGGGGTTCREEYVVVEVNYGDGTGWHVIWEGLAIVCE